MGQADQVNPYAYVGNDPLAWTDPTGKTKEFIEQHDVTDFILFMFNNGGGMLEDTYNSEWYLGSLSFLAENIAANHRDYNIKFNPYLLSKSIKDDDGKPTGFVYVGGTKVHVSELGNLLFGYVGTKGKVSTHVLSGGAYVVNLGKTVKERDTDPKIGNPFVYNYYNEREDRQMYWAGHDMAINTQTDRLTEQDLVKYMNQGQSNSRAASKMPAFGEFFQSPF